jgi:hypothetical protein
MPKVKEDNRSLEDFYSEELLMELLSRQSKDTDGSKLVFGKENEGPSKVTFYEKHYCINIGIGKDNTASIYLTQDDVNVLNIMLKGKHTLKTGE